MAEIKSMSRIKEKWTRVTPQRAEDYAIGVKNPKRPWDTSAVAAKESHKSAMQQAAANDSFAKGITKAGNAKWQSKAIAKGPGRFAEGVQIGGDDYEKGFAPAREVIEKTVLPPRFPRRDPRNNARTTTLNVALGKMKTG